MTVLRTLTLFLVLGFVGVTGVYDYLAAIDDTAALEETMATNLGVVARSLAWTLPTVENLLGPAAVKRLLDAQNREGTPKIHVVPAAMWASPNQNRVELRDGRMRLYRRLGDGDEMLEISSSLSRIEDKREQHLRRSLGKSAILVALGGLFTWLVGLRLVGRPVARLIAHARRIAAGDLSHETAHDDRGGGELAELAREINRMCARLRDAHAVAERENARRIRALEELRHADRMKTAAQLAEGIAHELGTPLNVVAGHAQMIGAGEPADEITADAHRIGVQTARMTAVIQQLLDFARARPLRLEEVELGPLCARTAELLSHLPSSHDVSLQVSTPSSPVWVHADPGQLQQALTNLVVNAIQASHDGDSVVLAVVAEADQARLSVIDYGAGIPLELQSRVFEPFFTTKPVGSAAGLGLSVAHGIAEDHAGHIEIGSELGRGTTATIVLPTFRQRTLPST